MASRKLEISLRRMTEARSVFLETLRTPNLMSRFFVTTPKERAIELDVVTKKKSN
jgi:hypothetical protein